MYWNKRWQDRGHNVIKSAAQFAIGVGNEAMGPGGIGGSGLGMRTALGVTGGILAGMGSKIGSDVMWGAIGSAAELGGSALVKAWRGAPKPAPAAEVVQGAPAAQPAAAVAPPPAAVAPAARPAEEIMREVRTGGEEVDRTIPAELFPHLAALSPALRAQVEAELRNREPVTQGASGGGAAMVPAPAASAAKVA